MPRNPDYTWPIPSWAQACECEELYGREFARKTWGSVFFLDEEVVKDYLPARVEDLEHAVDQLREAVIKSDAKYHFLLDKKKSKEPRHNLKEP